MQSVCEEVRASVMALEPRAGLGVSSAAAGWSGIRSNSTPRTTQGQRLSGREYSARLDALSRGLEARVGEFARSGARAPSPGSTEDLDAEDLDD